MLWGCVLDDVLFAEDGDATDLAVVLPDRQREGRVVEHGAMCAVVQRVRELKVATTTIYNYFWNLMKNVKDDNLVFVSY